MKHLILLLLPVVVFAQYWGERPNEKSFEASSVYFNSYYLNPLGIHNFSDVSLGLTNDPFLRAHLNPAYIPEDSLQANQFYLDFRGDRTEAEVAHYYPMNPYYDYRASYYMPDPRWYTVTRSEPEPLFSFGVSKQLTKDLYFSGSYQFVFKEEGFYQIPTWIYNSRYGYAEDGAMISDEASVPITDRSAGEDEMHTQAHMLSANLAYRLTPNLNLGVNVNSVIHERSGSYANLRADQYSESNEDDEWYNKYSKERDNQYKHLDLGAGLQYKFSDDLSGGIKVNYLDGKVTQDYLINDSSIYNYHYSSSNYLSDHNSYRTEKTIQDWLHKGQTKSATIQFDYKLSDTRSIHFYYQYQNKDLDLENKSVIADTSSYNGTHHSDTYHSIYNSWSKLSDVRSATGSSDMNGWKAMLTFRWLENEYAKINLGLFFSKQKYDKSTSEPVIARSGSYYYNEYNNNELEIYTRTNSLYENKRLEWQTSTEKQSLQIPVMLRFNINQTWELMMAVNRIWNYWNIEEETVAYFNIREEIENGQITQTTNFGERWSEPDRVFSEDMTAFLTGLTVNISPKFKINIMASPELEPHWRVSQWWLGFRAAL